MVFSFSVVMPKDQRKINRFHSVWSAEPMTVSSNSMKNLCHLQTAGKLPLPLTPKISHWRKYPLAFSAVMGALRLQKRHHKLCRGFSNIGWTACLWAFPSAVMPSWPEHSNISWWSEQKVKLFDGKERKKIALLKWINCAVSESFSGVLQSTLIHYTHTLVTAP